MFPSMSAFRESVKEAMSAGLMAGLKGIAGAGPKLNLGALTHGPVLKSEVGRLQSMARKGVGGLDTLPRPAPTGIRPLAIEKDPFKMAGILGSLGKNLASAAGTHKAELAGLGMLAVPSIDDAQAHARAALSGDYNKAGVKKRTFLPHAIKPLSEIAGLGVLAGPSAASLLGHHG